MSAFNLESDNQFIGISDEDSDNITVFEYMGDPNDFQMVYASSSRWRKVATIGSSQEFDALEVFGVTISDEKMEDLVNDLTFIDPTNDEPFYPLINRQGLCVLSLECGPVKRLRINDHFGWSKYGVVRPGGRVVSTVWNVCDMSNGVVLVDPPTMDDDDKKLLEEKEKLLEDKEKLLEEKNKLMEKNESLLRMLFEEKVKEVASVKAILKAMSNYLNLFSALEILGVTISEEGLATLARDLTINAKDGKMLYFMANRQGVCFVNVGQYEPIQWMRINGVFCWSKYGVVVKPEATDGAVLSRPLAIMPADCYP
ncbi:hypothetical protein LINPERHAP2_LOCUS32037 [Linum perenne]